MPSGPFSVRMGGARTASGKRNGEGGRGRGLPPNGCYRTEVNANPTHHTSITY